MKSVGDVVGGWGMKRVEDVVGGFRMKRVREDVDVVGGGLEVA